VEKDVRTLIHEANYKEIKEVNRVMVHYENQSSITTEILIKVDENMTVKASKDLAMKLKHNIMHSLDIHTAEISLDLSLDINENHDLTSPRPTISPFYKKAEQKYSIN
jgi:divalent metal cation (Fe/Co/Zn/Cd) transporter